MKNLCLAGGVALNCVGNGKIWEAGIFDGIWIQPAAGDAGGALGAALFVWHHYLGNPRVVDGKNDSQRGSYLGPSYSRTEIEEFLRARGAPYDAFDSKELPGRIARLLSEGAIVGWFSGRMEYGPRALGARSILGDPRNPEMQSKMNLKIKFRESFRPFAPAVLRERVADWFEFDDDSAYMLLCAPVKESHRIPERAEDKARFGIDRLNVPRSDIPAVTHVDYSARIQTVTKDVHGPYYDLIEAFRSLTGCPVLINTSFNVRGEPIVCTPEQAYACFMRTDIDVLVLGDCVLDKKKQPKTASNDDWKKEFVLD
jgi:carbamoyltransferase